MTTRPALDPYAQAESPLCPTCQGHNWEVNRNVDYRTTNHYEFVRLEILASAKLAFNRLKPRLLDLPLEQIGGDREVMETLLHLESIRKVFREVTV